MFYQDKSGVLVRSNGSIDGDSFVGLFASISIENEKKDAEWIQFLIDTGVKAAHPNNGWVDREKKIIRLVDPYFKCMLFPGDIIAIGDRDDYKLVKILWEITSKYVLRYVPTFLYKEIESETHLLCFSG